MKGKVLILSPPFKRPLGTSDDAEKPIPSYYIDEIISNQDILVNILHKLPLKPLMRFQSVSKTWQQLISDPHRPDSCYSVRTRLSSQPLDTPILGFFVKSNKSKEFGHEPTFSTISFSSPPPLPDVCLPYAREPYCVLASSKGILLYVSEGYKQPRLFYVYNPITRQTIKLPEVRNLFRISSVGFNCEVTTVGPTGLPVMHYMVAVLERNHILVSSSKEDNAAWKHLTLPRVGFNIHNRDYNRSVDTVIPGIVVMQGYCFWLDRSGHNVIMCDVRSGFRKMESPAFRINEIVRYVIGASQKDGLYFGALYRISMEIVVWVFEIGGRGWKPKYNVNVLELLNSYPEAFQVVGWDSVQIDELSLYGFHPCDPGVVFFTFQDKFCSYEFEVNQLKVLRSSNDFASYKRQLGFIPFKLSPWPYVLSQASNSGAVIIEINSLSSCNVDGFG